MSRSYRSVRPKANRVYSVEEVLSDYTICRNTLSNWVKAGLRPIDDRSPQLFQGAELKRFHDQRSIGVKRAYRTAEFNCFKCKARVIPELAALAIEESNHFRARATCPECCSRVSKILNATAYDTLRNCLESNTNLHSIDEGEGAVPVGVGTNPVPKSLTWEPDNERIIFAYQDYSRRFDIKTSDAHLAAIRDFERALGGTRLSAVTSKDAGSYRDSLLLRRSVGGNDGLSRSTIRHRASYLRAFFDWLVYQDGYRRMNKTIGDYFQLSRLESAKAIQPAPRAYPTTDQVALMVTSMPAATLPQRRRRAIVCASFLAGTRAAVTASLLIKHIDVEAQSVQQDATEVPVKNSKSQTTHWFPVDARITQIFIDWIAELRSLSFAPNDALFPPEATLIVPHRFLCRVRPPAEPLKTSRAVSEAFREACRSAGPSYFPPHSARHYLRSIRDEFCRTPDQRKAWSHNLGHENEQTTEAYYAKMTDQRRDQIFTSLGKGDRETEEEKDLLLAYHEHRLAPGTLEFQQAEIIHEARRDRFRVDSQLK